MSGREQMILNAVGCVGQTTDVGIPLVGLDADTRNRCNACRLSEYCVERCSLFGVELNDNECVEHADQMLPPQIRQQLRQALQCIAAFDPEVIGRRHLERAR